ncbi:hypothetical protein DFS34DRAFT_583429 [Phlyctochytrium arcticum]|nr:hypothetical protein DFS34DRAFT_583429 [Phlyctochytrium arcticum]
MWVFSLLLTLFTFSTIAQPPPPPPGQTTPTCNPILNICPPPLNCTDSDVLGRVDVLSPNRTTYFYVGQPVNISWSYSGETDVSKYPINNVSIYYQRSEASTWNPIQTVGAREVKYTWPMKDFEGGTGGTFKIRIVPDNIDRGGVTGTPSSCIPVGWPLLGEVQFTLVRPRPLDDARDPYPPALSRTLPLLAIPTLSTRAAIFMGVFSFVFF